MSKRAPLLERALEEARGAIGRQDDVERLRAKLGELPPAPVPSATAPTSVGPGAKLAIVTLTGALLIGAALLLMPRSSMNTPAPAHAPSRTPVSTLDARSAPAPAPMPATVPDAPSPALEAARAPAPPAKSAKRRVARAAEAIAPSHAPDPAPAELELLTRAHDAIEASPQRALSLIDDHARLYPSGSFAQEREALAIDVLRKLGRTTEARERARAFIARFPKASNVKHLARWLDAPSRSDHNEQARPLPTP